MSRPWSIQRRPADTSHVNHSRLNNAPWAAYTTSANVRCGCPDAVSQISEGDRQECRVTGTHRTQQAAQRNLLQEPGYNELSNKREPTSSNLTCRFQNYPIILDHVPNLSDITFPIPAIKVSSTEVLARRLIGTCAGCTQNYWSQTRTGHKNEKWCWTTSKCIVRYYIKFIQIYTMSFLLFIRGPLKMDVSSLEGCPGKCGHIVQRI